MICYSCHKAMQQVDLNIYEASATNDQHKANQKFIFELEEKGNTYYFDLLRVPKKGGANNYTCRHLIKVASLAFMCFVCADVSGPRLLAICAPSFTIPLHIYVLYIVAFSLLS